MQCPAAVLFDVGGTLLEERRFDLEAGIAAVVPDASAVATLAESFRSEVARYHERDIELSLADWLVERQPTLTTMPRAEIEDRIWSVVVTLVPTLNVERVLARLADDEIPMAAISNAPFSSRVLSAELERHRLSRYLRFVMSSADVGRRKPAPAIFHDAVKRLGAAVNMTWFVGDTIDEDIVGAAQSGLHPILIGALTTTRMPPVGADVQTVRDWSEFLALYLRARASHPATTRNTS